MNMTYVHKFNCTVLRNCSDEEDSVKHNKHSSSGKSNPGGSENGASYSTGSSDEGSRSRRKDKRSSSEHGLKKVVEHKHKDGKSHSTKDGHGKSQGKNSHKVRKYSLCQIIKTSNCIDYSSLRVHKFNLHP